MKEELTQSDERKVSTENLADTPTSMDPVAAMAPDELERLTELGIKRLTELEDRERYLRWILQNSPNVVLLIDMEGRLAYCTKSFMDLIGVKDASEIQGRTVREVYGLFGNNDFVEEAYARFDEIKATRETVSADVYIKFPSRREMRLYTIQSTPMLDEEGNMQGVLTLYHDTTDLRGEESDKRSQIMLDATLLAASFWDMRDMLLIEQERQDAVEHGLEMEVQARTALAASEAKSDFLASMSHEIRTPMNAILGMSELIRTDNLDKTQAQYLTDIRKTANSLLEIINDILNFSKIEAGKMELLPADYSIYSLYNNMCSLMQFMIADKPLRFEHSIDDNLPRALYGDEVRVRQVITNILNNAVKYTKKGYVKLHIGRVERYGIDCMSIEVADSGIGIKQADIVRLFEAFEQADKKQNRKIVGTGLGLTIAKRIVDLMGGEIQLESEYGKSSVFTVLIPIVEGDPNKVEVTEEIRSVTAMPGVAVLVVDDNLINLTVAQGFLAKHNITPDMAEGGREAVEMVQAKKYDLVLMDHMMPEFDGIEATKTIRRMDGAYYKALPIVALSANAVSGARESFIEAGMNDFISKPIEAAELNRVLIKWIPPEKLTYEDDGQVVLEADDSAADTEDAEVSNILVQLMEIKGLDTVVGLARVNRNAEAYIKILRQFCKGAEEDIEAICSFEERRDWEAYAIRAHALKSVFANIGHQELSDWAAQLEEAATKGRITTCVDQTKDFCEAIKEFQKDLLRTQLMKYADHLILGKPTENKQPAKQEKNLNIMLAHRMKALNEACLDCDAERAEEIIEELRHQSFGIEVDTVLVDIYELVEAFDYDEVIGKSGEVLGMIQNHP